MRVNALVPLAFAVVFATSVAQAKPPVNTDPCVTSPLSDLCVGRGGGSPGLGIEPPALPPGGDQRETRPIEKKQDAADLPKAVPAKMPVKARARLAPADRIDARKAVPCINC